MTTYSDWIIIPKDRKCDLPRDAKVQMMWRHEDVKDAEENNDVEDVRDCICPDGLWLPSPFAYRVVQEPVEEVREYEYSAYLTEYGTMMFSCGFILHKVTPGTATQTTRDGRPYRFTWEASE